MRYLTPAIEEVITQENKMALIAGPRQVGKTTLAKSFLEKAAHPNAYFNWDNERHRRAILNSPDGFWRENVILTGSQRYRVALDEIHKYPRWKRFLKGLFDVHRRELELLVTGSGRLDVYQRGGDSLFGRASVLRLHPFSLGEMLQADRLTVKSPENFWEAIRHGDAPSGHSDALALIDRFSGFPEPLFAGSERRYRKWRREHHRLILREDLRDLTRIREIGLIESLIHLLPERVGSPLSINNLREVLGVAFVTVQSWLQALERLYYVFEIRPYAGQLSRALRREGKIYFYDHTQVEEPGARFENMVALHLRKLTDAWTDWGYGDFALHYVRNKEKKETDFLITESHKPYALIEAKLSAEALDPSLVYFHDRLKTRYAVQVVKTGREKGRSKDILILPASHFLFHI